MNECRDCKKEIENDKYSCDECFEKYKEEWIKEVNQANHKLYKNPRYM